MDDVEKFDFYEVSYGLMKRRTYRNGMLDEHPVIFPNIFGRKRGANPRTHGRYPYQDLFLVRFFPTEDRSVVENEEPPVEYIEPYKNPPDGFIPTPDPHGSVQAQDQARENQGPIADRTRERLTSSDCGIVLLREVMFREIKKVQQGLDPMGVVKDPAKNPFLYTHLMESITKQPRSRTARRERRVQRLPLRVAQVSLSACLKFRARI